MIEKLFCRKIDDEVKILLKAIEDVRNGIFTVSKASDFYGVSPAAIVTLIAETREYEEWMKRAEEGRRVKYAD